MREGSNPSARIQNGGDTMGNYTKQKRTHKGSMSVSCVANADIVKRLDKLEHDSEIAIQKTVSDFRSRAPGWVSQGIREHYGVDTKAIKEAQKKPKRGRTSIKVKGAEIDGVVLEYRGRTLTPLHFKMSPKKQPATKQNKMQRIPGQAVAADSPVAMIAPPKKYRVKATIIKGQRTNLPPGTFLAPGNGGVVLPFQRQGKGRMPIEAIRTLSVPQMIDGRAKETIEKTIQENMQKRFEHHIEQIMK